jgi:hypothetical protein
VSVLEALQVIAQYLWDHENDVPKAVFENFLDLTLWIRGREGK